MNIIAQSELINFESGPLNKLTSLDDLPTDMNQTTSEQDDQPIDTNLENTPVVPYEIDPNSPNIKYK